eukprot:TRINITY_DN19537_c0_g1_i1.p1 TRINITY_DN19537_c0_g1~~TRINITY_DN19537_c0_g1_i1.p1  ORF type:complete len:689 (+),score=262.59 TRINITY_DN19537_c0_g1_i1:91-2157(+)
MKSSTLALALAASATSADAEAAAVTPIQKVVEMLQGMLATGNEEKQKEQVQFAAYKQWCDGTSVEKQRMIEEAKEQVTMLTADIQVAQTDASKLAEEIQALDGNIATFHADIKASTSVREQEKTDYQKVHKDYSESVEAIEKAVQVLKARAAATPQAPAPEALLEVLHADKPAPAAAMRAIAAFLESSQDPLDGSSTGLQSGPPEVNAYEFQSGGVVEMLEKLRDKFVDERSTLEKEEAAKHHAHDLLVQDLTKSIQTAEQSKTDKAQQKAKALQSASQMKGDLQDAQTTGATESKTLSDIEMTCKQKAADYEERQKLRQEELQAISKAIEILNSDAITGTVDAHTAAMVQQAGSSALVQMRSGGQAPATAAALTYLNDQADKIQSQTLMALAVRLKDDPFAKVKKLIQDMIVRLQEEAHEETQHKAWCDTELAENEQVRTSRSSLVEKLQSEIEQKKAYITKMSSEVTILQKDVADTDAQVAEMTKSRNAEKSTNDQTVKDAQAAQAAVGQAITVLREFYAASSSATALMQQKSRQATKRGKQQPEIFEGSYTGMQAENGGVIAMLEVIQADYARLESSTSAMEATAQKEYDRYMSDTAVQKAQNEKDIEHKNHEQQQSEQQVMDFENDLASAQKELEAANNYYDKLKPSCLNTGMSFEDRAARRQEEIQSLQEALRILEGEDISAA